MSEKRRRTLQLDACEMWILIETEKVPVGDLVEGEVAVSRPARPACA